MRSFSRTARGCEALAPDARGPLSWVRVVVRYGEAPELRRAERVKNGWTEHGAKVNFYRDRTPPMPWAEVGTCWAGTHHPVVDGTGLRESAGHVASSVARLISPSWVASSSTR
jgi:hypothetical protein